MKHKEDEMERPGELRRCGVRITIGIAAVLMLAGHLSCGPKVRSLPLFILDHEGKPVPEAVVTVESGSARQSSRGNSFVTDATGQVLIDSLVPAGNVELEIETADAKHKALPMEVTHAEIEARRPIEVTLPPLPEDRRDSVKVIDVLRKVIKKDK